MKEPCDRCEELLQDFLDRTLTDIEWQEAEAHLGGCDYCRRRYRFEETPPPVRASSSASNACRPGSWRSSRSFAASTRRPSRLDKPGPDRPACRRPRASRGRRRGRGGRDVRVQPLVRDVVPVVAAEHERMSSVARVRRGDDAAISRQASSTRSTASGARSGPSARTTTAASMSLPSASRPHRSDAPGPRAQSSHREPTETLLVGRTWSGRTRRRRPRPRPPARGEALEHAAGAGAVASDAPNRVASPAASTIAATFGISSRRR